MCIKIFGKRLERICNLNKAVVINKETIHLFISRFLEFGSTTLFIQFVVEPRNIEELNNCNNEFSISGIPGCIVSTDTTHVASMLCANYILNIKKNILPEHTTLL